MPTPTRSVQEIKREANLTSIVRSIDKLERELRSKQEERRSLYGEGRQEEISQQIQDIVTRLEQLRHNFNEIASGVDPEALVSRDDETSVDWAKDLREILSPVINEVRRLTRRPRELDRLRTFIEEAESQTLLIDQAVNSLKSQIDSSDNETLRNHLAQSLQDFESRKQAIQTQLGISRQKLDRKLSEQQSLSDSIHNIFQIFFRSRGVNLALAVVCALLFWLVARRMHLWSSNLFPKESGARGFYGRLISVFLTLSTIFGAVVVFLLALYFVGDWVLLILALMLLLGVLWASKQAVHQFWTHATLLLNMGVAREGERVMIAGVPWLIQSLNFYTRLVNPELTGGDMHVPIRDLTGLRSREFADIEPWFPTRQEDWILLDDKVVAQVVMQSMDFVKLAILGGGERMMPTSKFLDMAAFNLSRGFRHSFSFGIDYRHQAVALTEIPSTLLERLRQALAVSPWAQWVEQVRVEFDEPAASSLNYAVQVDFCGEAAPDYSKIGRFIRATCVAACTDCGWVIPFPQMTVHVEGQAGKA